MGERYFISFFFFTLQKTMEQTFLTYSQQFHVWAELSTGQSHSQEEGLRKSLKASESPGMEMHSEDGK
jgi:hypothetical protein